MTYLRSAHFVERDEREGDKKEAELDVLVEVGGEDHEQAQLWQEVEESQDERAVPRELGQVEHVEVGAEVVAIVLTTQVIQIGLVQELIAVP